VQILRLQGTNWESWRRTLDYYPEGELIWLEVDTLIRQQTKGAKSLDDFCRVFHGGESGAPRLSPYTFQDVVTALNGVTPYEWEKLLRDRTQNTSTHAPFGGIQQGGWKLVYNDTPNAFMAAAETVGRGLDLSYSIGIELDKNGEVEDVIPDSSAAQAGIAPRMKILAVNQRRWSKNIMLDAIRTASKTHQPIQLLIENAQSVKTYSVAYSDGLRYPHLERSEGQADVLANIIRPITK
jgi:predicted metalloprotease with PDZ domain